jgi:hypothetical protein
MRWSLCVCLSQPVALATCTTTSPPFFFTAHHCRPLDRHRLVSPPWRGYSPARPFGRPPHQKRRCAPHHYDPNKNHQIHHASDTAQSSTAVVRSQSPREPLSRSVLLPLRDCAATGQRQPLHFEVCVGTAASAVKSASYAERRPPSRPACHNLSEPVLRKGYPYHDQ